MACLDVGVSVSSLHKEIELSSLGDPFFDCSWFSLPSKVNWVVTQCLHWNCLATTMPDGGSYRATFANPVLSACIQTNSLVLCRQNDESVLNWDIQSRITRTQMPLDGTCDDVRLTRIFHPFLLRRPKSFRGCVMFRSRAPQRSCGRLNVYKTRLRSRASHALP